jgi:precorrin-2 dehydrogenase
MHRVGVVGNPLIDTDLYVACIDLSGRRVLVVGAGDVALEKIGGLRACAADVVVVAPEVSDAVSRLATDGAIELRRRTYESRDLDGCFLVIAATSSTEVNTQVRDDSEARSMLVNVVDVPSLCNFILPSIVRDPPIAVAISTAGASPALAKRMKREAAAAFGPSYARLARILGEQREWAKAELRTYDDRKDFFEDIVNGTPDPIELLDRGDEDAVAELVESARRRATS